MFKAEEYKRTGMNALQGKVELRKLSIIGCTLSVAPNEQGKHIESIEDLPDILEFCGPGASRKKL